MKILVLNAGSSSHKACLFDLTSLGQIDQPPLAVWRAQLDWTYAPGTVELVAKKDSGESIKQVIPTSNKAEGLGLLLQTLTQGPTQVIQDLQEINGVGHRVVHGGRDHQRSTPITPAVKAAIQDLIPLAPAHNPSNLEGIEILEQMLPGVRQIAVFDTAFHACMPEAAATYPGPYGWLDQGIRRYGFHGISHQYVAQRAAHLLQQDLSTLKLASCHLGNGCSLAAVKHGYSVDTTMGFTPLEGLMMGSRSGSVDPGILIYLMRQKGYTADQIDQVLNQESGLKGLSGLSNDLRVITDAIAQGNHRARLALDVFIHRLTRELGSMVASLGGLDALVFTAGMGENSPLIWEKACAPFAFLNLRLDSDRLYRSAQDRDIAAPDSAVRVLVIHTQEEWAIAQDCMTILQTPPTGSSKHL